MFKTLLKSNKPTKPDLETLQAFYAGAVGLSRAPVFYTRFETPDTNDGRFDLLCLMLSLFLFRIQKDDPAMAQGLFDYAFKDVERGLREAGVGDLGVPKHMKRMIQGFYGRSASYYEALEQGDTASLNAVLVRNLYNGNANAPAGPMAEWVQIAWSYLSQIDYADFARDPKAIMQLLPPDAPNRQEAA